MWKEEKSSDGENAGGKLRNPSKVVANAGEKRIINVNLAELF